MPRKVITEYGLSIAFKANEKSIGEYILPKRLTLLSTAHNVANILSCNVSSVPRSY